jgi:sterol desaturase/sphingolipid hydroxylase (fatty acid hydroxylase superfamily)
MSNTDASIIRLLLSIGGLLFFLFFEVTAAYRPNSVSKLKGWFINLSLTLFNAIFLNLVFATSIVTTITYVSTHQLGVLNMINLPTYIRVFITVVFMDFMLYVWHLLNHEIPFLWRFHRVHHCGLNMDVSTATRFHTGELAISAIIKMALIFFLGADFLSIIIFESALLVCAQFHHSSLKVPHWLESIFWILLAPPSMHRIHHSLVIKERNTNYGTIFSIWDRMLETLLTQVKQDKIRIGVGAHPQLDRLNFYHLPVMPFTRPVR